MFADPTPLFTFGHGLSYTSFAYSALQVSPGAVEPGADMAIQVSLEVANTGAYEGRETVQLYVNDVVSSVTTPVKALKGFRKITLGPGCSERVSFVLRAEDLMLWDQRMQQIVEPGTFEVTVGGLTASFEVLAGC